MSNFTPVTPELGLQAINVTSTTKNHDLGHRIRARDATLGEGEFIYLKGVASTVVGSLVSYDIANSTTTLVPSTANLGNPLAVAMSANVLLGYGWYQIAGPAVIKKTAVKISPTVKLYIGASAGRVSGTLATGKAVWGAISTNSATVASATSTVNALLAYPVAEGSVT